MRVEGMLLDEVSPLALVLIGIGVATGIGGAWWYARSKGGKTYPEKEKKKQKDDWVPFG